MYCPLFATGILARANINATAHFDCIKEECAWWDSPTKACAIARLAMSLNVIVAELGVIKDKLGDLAKIQGLTR